MAEVRATGIAIGDEAPSFDLPAAPSGARQSLDRDAKATVVVFTCNHCPYALAWHDRLLDAARDYADLGVRFFALNSNDASRYPADSWEAMEERMRNEEWSFPYLHDAEQDVARAYGAQTTPDVFVFDGDLKLRYRGAPDEDHSDPSKNAAWLRGALDAVLDGREPDPAETKPVGCSVKWKG